MTMPLDKYAEDYTLDELKRHAKRDMDAGAGTIRSRYITTSYGQAETYLAKENQARSYKAAVSPIDAEYPMLLAEVGITAAAVSLVADAIVAKANEWQTLAGQIEAVRLGTKQQIDAATTEEEINTIMAAVSWPAPE